MKFYFKFACLFSLASCSQLAQDQSREQSLNELLASTPPSYIHDSPSVSHDYSKSEKQLQLLRTMLNSIAKENLEGVELETHLSPLARKRLSEVEIGNIAGYYETITKEAYGGKAQDASFVVLSQQDLLELSQAKGYFLEGSQEDDYILFSMKGMKLNCSIAFSMPNIIFLEYILNSKQWRCAINCPSVWEKIYNALICKP